MPAPLVKRVEEISDHLLATSATLGNSHPVTGLTERKCRTCHITYPIKKFHRKNRTRIQTECVLCATHRHRLWVAAAKARGTYKIRAHSRELDRLYQRKHYNLTRAAGKARRAVAIALKKGRLLLSPVCEKCERPVTLKTLNCHHPSYKHKLLVIVLCKKCHRWLHSVKAFVPPMKGIHN